MLAKKYHPDNEKTGDEKKMKEIQEAYDILSDSQKRREYDEELKYQCSQNRSSSKSEEMYDFSNFEKDMVHHQEGFDDDMYDFSNIEKDVVCNDDEFSCEEELYEEEVEESTVGSFFKKIGKGIMNQMNKFREQSDEARAIGERLNDRELIRRYRNSSGGRKHGYAKVLEERGFLEKNNDGVLVPTNKMKSY